MILQGVDYANDRLFSVFGNAGTEAVVCVHYKGELERKEKIKFKKKWHHRNDYEVEGIRVHPETGEIWIGWTVTTYLLTRNNYIQKI